MTEQAKAAQREYMKKWRDVNRDKIRTYNSTYWERKAAAIKAENSLHNNYNEGVVSNGEDCYR